MKKSKFEEFLLDQLKARLSTTRVETEQKYHISDPVQIRRQLIHMRAKKLRSGLEHNELFDINKMLRKKKQILRLRFHGSGGAWLTFKGPRQKGIVKKRMEIETPIHFESAKRILELLGFRVFSTYRKNREEYELPGGKVCLDYLPKCGWFVEIEGSTKNISRIASDLGLDHADREERSYRKLLRDHTLLAAV